MARRSQSILDDLVELPWWVSVAFAAVVYTLARFAAPVWLATSPITAPVGTAISQLAWMFAAFFLLPAPFAGLRQYRRRKLLDAQADLNSISALNWEEFEKLVAEAFSREGYSVAEKGGPLADGGVDIVLRRGDERVIVQCKHWRTRMVGVAQVRELYGVMVSEHAAQAILVTSGSFSTDAYRFAYGKPLRLIDGPSLERLVAKVRQAPINATPDPAATTLNCPECGSRMVKRTATKGIKAGSQFWGCSRYPACRGIRQAA